MYQVVAILGIFLWKKKRQLVNKIRVFECVCPFCEIGAQRVNITKKDGPRIFSPKIYEINHLMLLFTKMSYTLNKPASSSYA